MAEKAGGPVTKTDSGGNYVLDAEAQAYVDRVFPCITKEFPNEKCDSWGVCENCCEKGIFGAGYNFGKRAVAEQSPANTASTRDAAAHEFVNECPKYSGYPEHLATFKAGWDARDEEVKRLKEAISVISGNVFEFEAENKRLREALEGIDHHLQSAEHMKRRYEEVGKTHVGWDRIGTEIKMIRKELDALKNKGD